MDCCSDIFSFSHNSLFHEQKLWAEYDFIVVGGGSAGAVLAARLSEIEDWKVLLLEAGEDETAWSDVPGAAKYLQLTKMDWQYQTEPQTGQCLAMKGKRYILFLWSVSNNDLLSSFVIKGAIGLEEKCWVALLY